MHQVFNHAKWTKKIGRYANMEVEKDQELFFQKIEANHQSSSSCVF
jgi:hypothetical protein